MRPGRRDHLLALHLEWPVSQEDHSAAAPIGLEWLRARGPPSMRGGVLLCPRWSPGVTGLHPVCLGLRRRADMRRASHRRFLEVFLVILVEMSWHLRFYTIHGFCCALIPNLTLLVRVTCLPHNCWRVWRPFDLLAWLGSELSRSGVLRILFWWSFVAGI
ncbi:hypothetical protein NDU88_006764 [Pleurodeles waltl]|uniref:Uncharacterized protein n=1 Tax=Pleurodeles waltl TaxID=8319 RepID=A0AAV7N057_PLEWA|nr:hypothetical protein NDU88_006764 [Pleurodeles waltl]